MTLKTSLFFLMSLFLPCYLMSASFSFQLESQPVEKIEIKVMPAGKELDAEQVRSRMRIREKDLFSQTDFDNDLKVLAREFDRVFPKIESVDGRVYLTLEIWPKPTIRTITCKGNQRIEAKTLKSELGINSSTVFDRLAVNKAFHKLKAYYVKKGFFEAQLEYKIYFDELTNEVDIEIIINEGRSGMIKDIVFCGFSTDEQDDILEMMMTKKYNLFLSWLTNEGTYNEDAVQQDQYVILNYLQNKGYADAQVEIEVCEVPREDRIIINIRATKGSLYSFGELTFTGNKLFCDELIWKEFIIKKGDPYSPQKIRETIENITHLYGKKGHIDAVVDFEPKLDCEGNIYSVHFTIEEGDQFRVGLIKVFGNSATQTHVILHETLVIPGEVFNLDKLESSEERLKNIGYFKNVNVYAVKSEGPCSLGDNYRDVHVEVEETSTGNFGAFFGYSTVESVFGGFNITEKNFNSQGLSRVFRDGLKCLRGGGEYLHFTTTIGKKSRSYVLSWTKPYFMDTEWSVGFDIERSSNRYYSNDYDIEATGFTLHGGYQLNPFVKIGLHYRLRNTHVNVSNDAPEQLREEARNSGIVSAVGASWIYDSTDHPVRPSDGLKSRVDVEAAGLGGKRFFAFSYSNSYYYQTDPKGVLKFRADVRFIFPVFGDTGDSLPLDERIFLGGDNQIRGYRPYKLGPRFKKDTGPKGEKRGGEPRGGISMQLLSVEYNRKLFKKLDAFVFFDAGCLSLNDFDFGPLSASLGYGIRFQIFDGGPPLILGMGYPINPKSRGEVKKFFMNIGGRF
jgi:outer membrane protein insertion porin family